MKKLLLAFPLLFLALIAWFGFNTGSTGGLSAGRGVVAARVGTTTMLASASGAS